MARYFFNVMDGKSLPDAEGVELLDDARAKTAAIKVCGEVLRYMRSYQEAANWGLEVKDAKGRRLFTVRLVTEEHDVLG